MKNDFFMSNIFFKSKTKQNTAPPAPQSKDLKKKGVSFDEFGTEPQKTFSKSGILKAESSPAVMAAPSPPVKVNMIRACRGI